MLGQDIAGKTGAGGGAYGTLRPVTPLPPAVGAGIGMMRNGDEFTHGQVDSCLVAVKREITEDD
jgi:hypothetical protein